MEEMEDKYDLECYEKAMQEYNKNSKMYTLEEVKKSLDLK